MARSHSYRALLLTMLLLGAGRSAAQEEPPPAGEPSPQEEAADRAFALAKQGRALTKAKRFTEGLAQLAEAAHLADRTPLTVDDQAELHYAYGKGLARAHQHREAIAELEHAVSLRPKDAEVLEDLAEVYDSAEDYDHAIKTAQEALALGLSGDDARDARELIREARLARLHSRLAADATVTFGYDSNVLQGSVEGLTTLQRETIGDRFTGGKLVSIKKTLSAVQLKQDLKEDYTTLSNYFFANPTVSPAAWNLPINIRLGIEARLAGDAIAGLWLGYRFTQYLLPVPSDPSYDLDQYNLQEHDLGLRFVTNPAKWFKLSLRAEGFVNFSGLTDFSPYLGGYTLALELVFKEAEHWQTKLLAQNQGRWAMERGAMPTLTDCGRNSNEYNTYMDGNRTDVTLMQTFKNKVLQAKLSYKLHYDRTGAEEEDVPIDGPAGAQLGCYEYTSTFSFVGNEVAARAVFYLPWRLDLNLGAGYEYRVYPDPYSMQVYLAKTPKLISGLSKFSRDDNIVNADITLTKNLPRGFGVDLTYQFTYNQSTIANFADNRNYNKSVVFVAGTYLF